MSNVVLVIVGLGAIAAGVSSGSVEGPDDGGGDFGQGDPLSIVLTGANFAVLLAGILGALAGAREYGSGITATIRPGVVTGLLGHCRRRPPCRRRSS